MVATRSVLLKLVTIAPNRKGEGRTEQEFEGSTIWLIQTNANKKLNNLRKNSRRKSNQLCTRTPGSGISCSK